MAVEKEYPGHPDLTSGGETDLHSHAGAPYTQGASVWHSSSQSIPNAKTTVLAFSTEHYDTDDIHDLVTNNSRLTCKTAGKYIAAASAVFVSNATGNRYFAFYLNGASAGFGAQDSASQVDKHGLVITAIFDLEIGDYLEVAAYQSSGAALNVYAAPRFMMQRIG